MKITEVRTRHKRETFKIMLDDMTIGFIQKLWDNLYYYHNGSKFYPVNTFINRTSKSYSEAKIETLKLFFKDNMDLLDKFLTEKKIEKRLNKLSKIN